MNKKILIVEDEQAIGKALQLKLTHEGYEVELVGDGQEALTALQSGEYALMLMDLVMPNLDGFELLAQLKEAENAPKVIVLSNLSQAEDAEKARSLGASGFFIKSDTPINVIVDEAKKALS